MATTGSFVFAAIVSGAIVFLVIFKILSVRLRKRQHEDQFVCKFLPDGTIRHEVSCRLDFRHHDIWIHDFSIPLFNIGTVVIPYVAIKTLDVEKTRSGLLVDISHYEGSTRIISEDYLEIIKKINERCGKNFVGYL